MMKIRKANLLFMILTIAMIAGTSVVFANAKSDTPFIGLFEHVSEENNLEKYVNHVNEVSEESSTISTKDTKLFVTSTIFTDHHVYAIIGLEDQGTNELDISGRVTYADVDQTIYGLKGVTEEIWHEEGIRYFFYTGKIGKPSLNKQSVIVVGDHFLKFNSLRDFEGTLLKLSVDFNDEKHHLATTVRNVFTDALTFDPDTSQYVGDFYESVILTPYELKLKGKSESLLSTDESSWEQLHFNVTIVRKGNENINMSYDTRGSISDEGFPLGMSRGHNSDTGKFYHYWGFHGWKLNLHEVSALIIDGETYRVKKQ